MILWCERQSAIEIDNSISRLQIKTDTYPNCRQLRQSPTNSSPAAPCWSNRGRCNRTNISFSPPPSQTACSVTSRRRASPCRTQRVRSLNPVALSGGNARRTSHRRLRGKRHGMWPVLSTKLHDCTSAERAVSRAFVAGEAATRGPLGSISRCEWRRRNYAMTREWNRDINRFRRSDTGLSVTMRNIVVEFWCVAGTVCFYEFINSIMLVANLIKHFGWDIF